METSPILKVAVLPDGRTAVFPQSKRGDYQYVYREAAGVYWDQAMECFVSTPPQEWSSQKWYQHIVSAVRSGVGLQMILTADTLYESKDVGFEASIKLADQALWR
jgi:hypothetical protein